LNGNNFESLLMFLHTKIIFDLLLFSQLLHSIAYTAANSFSFSGDVCSILLCIADRRRDARIDWLKIELISCSHLPCTFSLQFHGRGAEFKRKPKSNGKGTRDELNIVPLKPSYSIDFLNGISNFLTSSVCCAKACFPYSRATTVRHYTAFPTAMPSTKHLR